jgi:hypothetical protein
MDKISAKSVVYKRFFIMTKKIAQFRKKIKRRGERVRGRKGEQRVAKYEDRVL